MANDDTPDEDLPKCSRCGRPNRPWPLERGDRCSPVEWAVCIRPYPSTGGS